MATTAESDDTRAPPPKPAEGDRPATRPIWLLPGVVAVVVTMALYFLPNILFPGTNLQFMLRSMWQMLPLAILGVWWLFLNRTPWSERILGLGLFGGTLVGTKMVLDESLGGVRGLLMAAIPWGIVAFVAAVFLFLNARSVTRLLAILALSLMAFLPWIAVRMEGVDGSIAPRYFWRWQKTREQVFVESHQSAAPAHSTTETTAITLRDGDWPAFRGPNRDGVVYGVSLDPDWKSNPPIEKWRIKVGPGWSSFCVVDGRAFTQEQRLENEAVVCYDADTGKELWVANVKARFQEAVGGPGPRATPTFADGQLYACGADGDVLRIDPADGKIVWLTSMKNDLEVSPPIWGFAASPAVVDGSVVVYSRGDTKSKDPSRQSPSWVAFNVADGKLNWGIETPERHSYSSAHVVELAGVKQVLLSDDAGLRSVTPDEGTELWRHDWETQKQPRVAQPMVIGRDRVLLGTGYGLGTRSLKVEKNGDDWKIAEEWTSKDLKPYFNDFVLHEGHLYGFDHDIFCCVDAATGKKKWKQGRYGCGQVVLVADSRHLLIVREKDGAVVLVEATPDKHRELALFKVLNNKTWNHPVLVGNRLYVRNDEEAVCLELPLVKK